MDFFQLCYFTLNSAFTPDWRHLSCYQIPKHKPALNAQKQTLIHPLHPPKALNRSHPQSLVLKS